MWKLPQVIVGLQGLSHIHKTRVSEHPSTGAGRSLGADLGKLSSCIPKLVHRHRHNHQSRTQGWWGSGAVAEVIWQCICTGLPGYWGVHGPLQWWISRSWQRTPWLHQWNDRQLWLCSKFLFCSQEFLLPPERFIGHGTHRLIADSLVKVMRELTSWLPGPSMHDTRPNSDVSVLNKTREAFSSNWQIPIQPGDQERTNDGFLLCSMSVLGGMERASALVPL